MTYAAQVKAPILEDRAGCVALVDFNVTNKPNPPPIKLLATLYALTDTDGTTGKFAWEFSDPADKDSVPLNLWVWPTGERPRPPYPPFVCPRTFSADMRDMGDGDQKRVEIEGTKMTILPAHNQERWKVEAKLDPETCSALIDFSVPGKPNPPPCKLTATLWAMKQHAVGKEKFTLEFTDTPDACKFGDPGTPLNEWVQELTKPSLV